MWWPHPKDLQDLEVEENEEGFTLSAPEGSECFLWLQHFNQTEELRLEFETELQNCLLNYLKQIDGESKISDQSEIDCAR